MKNYSDVPKSDFAGYPFTVYDDGDTKLEIWKFNGHISDYSQLVLLIANSQFLNKEFRTFKVNIRGDDYVKLNLPSKMKPGLKNALNNMRFHTECEDHIEQTDEFLIVRLEDSVAHDFGNLLDENHVIYDKERYIQFIKDRGIEEGELEKVVPETGPTRLTHRNVAIINSKIAELRAHVEAVEVNSDDSYDKDLGTLLDDADTCFEEINYLLENIPTSGSTEEEEAVLEIERKVKELERMRREKLDEMGYESAEGSRDDMLPNGEDED